MWQDRPKHCDKPEKADGEGWLWNGQLQLIVQFTPAMSTAHAQWVNVRTFHWRPPDYPIPQTTLKMLRHNAIETWQQMLRTDWSQCKPPVS